ncbi:MAG: DEAD/DEAH box helicase family protein, partial [bacterium]|nr:DEAD/DEAH box helicase family protein [bacterium]
MEFKLKADFSPTGDQPEAIEELTKGVLAGFSDQVLLGVTGSGKTFTVANVIQNVQKPTLVISHNKTLAAQLYQEFRDFFPQNAVSYFVSYYDYYQPEAYIPRTDTYIAKETEINEEIDKLRLAATANLLTRKDVIVIASVSCIYNLGSPKEYGRYILELSINDSSVTREKTKKRLVELQYSRTNSELKRGTFRLTGETMEIFPAYEDKIVRLKFTGETLGEINFFDPLTWKKLNDEQVNATVIYPAKHYLADPKSYTAVFKKIRKDLTLRVRELKREEKELEARRLSERVN